MRARAFDAEHELVGAASASCSRAACRSCPARAQITRYLPSTAGLELGGDWYDVIPLPDHHVASSSATSRATAPAPPPLMGRMRTALRAAVEGHPAGRVVVSHANPTPRTWSGFISRHLRLRPTSTWRRAPPGASGPDICRRYCATPTGTTAEIAEVEGRLRR